MGELYLRKVVVDIFPPSGSGKRIDDLRIRFKIEKTNESTPNDAEIEIYNLADTTRTMLEAPKTKVQVSIGYLGLNPDGFVGGTSSVAPVFIGDVNKTKHHQKHDPIAEKGLKQKVDGCDIVTEIKAADGGNQYRNGHIDKGYPPNVKLADVLTDFGTSMGLQKGRQEGIPDKTYANGLAFSGLTRDHLDTMTKANGLEWSVQDESLQILPAATGSSESVILISPDTGLVGIPHPTAKGVEFDCLIQPLLRQGRRVQIKSRVISGTFKLRVVKHDGDSFSGDFLSRCEATR